ncbi:hypothetical protein F1D05_02305 [Kribbella qitaiheensis]|uniref:Uncharacterized protein n=1 Tax=Kribbella qitaiheensis TaxID=1544730 RepID=A0A7G6WSI4_9ACTN|nr:hypothetical protein [Kribbella qitaiheensis]QNE16949.1 hypothetical protein F1D05_02305 [Kribbella qitaiheensis]
MAVLVADRVTGRFADKTREVARYVQKVDGRVEIVFTGRSGSYKYGPERVRIVAPVERVRLGEGRLVEVDGAIWETATEVCTFHGPDGAWSRVFYSTGQGEARRSRPAAQVRIVTDAAGTSRVPSPSAWSACSGAS